MAYVSKEVQFVFLTLISLFTLSMTSILNFKYNHVLRLRATKRSKQQYKANDTNVFKYLPEYEIIQITEKGNDITCEKLLNLKTFGINFKLCMNQDLKTVRPDIVISVKGESSETEYQKGAKLHSIRSVYKGHVINDKKSIAYGKIYNHTFDGYFVFDNVYYYIEPVSNFIPTNTSNLSIVYKTLKNERNLLFDISGDKPFDNRSKWWQNYMKSKRKYSMKSVYQQNSSNRRREKRSVNADSCSLHLVADHTFYENVGRKSVGATVSELMYRVGNADIVFRGTDFNGDGYGDNIGFKIAKITVFVSKHADDYKLWDESLNVNDYLDKFSEYDFNGYCLATAFTYRDFEDGILGLAWVASSSIYGAVGGICQQQVRFSGDNTLYSLNTAVVTMLNYGERILSYELGLVLTHELGHNFGSDHDPIGDQICAPDDENGNYMMYPYASDGSKPNHDKFSSCSISSIYPVIVNKGWCFVPYNGSFCGDYFVEAEEECDCGDEDTCSSIDPCCSPRSRITGPDPPCTFRRSLGYECSAKNSPCCTEHCKFMPDSKEYTCSESTECKFKSVCNGTSAECPANKNKMDGTVCDNGRKLCKSGVCLVSICKKHGLEPCRCRETQEYECLICCKFANSSQCSPASTFAIYGQHGEDLYIKPGDRCNSAVGICNDHGNCLYKDDLSAMERMFSDDTASEIRKWFKDYWYYVLAGVGGLTILVIIFVINMKKKQNVQVHAFRLGRLQNLISTAEIEIQRQEENLQQKEETLDSMINTIKRDNKSTAYVKALGRLTNFFPTAPLHVVTQVAKKASNESVAIRLLLMKGYPIRKLVKEKSDSNTSVNLC